MNTPSMSSKDSNPFSGLRGLPHLLFASGQTIPNIIGMKELNAEGYALLHTNEFKPDRLRAICSAFRFKELMRPVKIDAIDTQLTEKKIREATPALLSASPAGWVWNFTPGTKQMMIGVMRGLTLDDIQTTPLKGSIYVETGRKGTISLLDPGCKAPLATKLNPEELLTAQGILKQGMQQKGISRLIYKLPIDTTLLSPPWPELSSGIARNLKTYSAEIGRIRATRSSRAGQCRKYLELLKRSGDAGILPDRFPGTEEEEKNFISFMNGKWLEIYLFRILEEMKRAGDIDDVRWSLEIWKWDDTDKTYSNSTDLDVVFTQNNNLCHVSCKTELKKGINDELLRISSWKRLFGGAFGRGIIVNLTSRGFHHKSFASELQVGIIQGRDCLEPDVLKQKMLECCS